MNYYLSVLKKYAVFEGRARRSEYWYFSLFNAIAFMITLIIGLVLKMGMVLYVIYALAVIIPGIAVSVRRLHDIGKSGWMIFVNLIPFVGSVWFLILLITDSIQGDNEYGANPKMETFVNPATVNNINPQS